VRDGKLLGLVMRYDARNQTADVLPSPVIQRFLASFKKNTPAGLARVGIGYSPTRDPQLRRYIGLTDSSGVYVNEVRTSSAAAKAGLKRGDVILSVGGKRIDQDGNYEDPRFGRLSFSHLTSIGSEIGEKVDFEIFRDGKKQVLPVTLEALDRGAIISEPFVFDRQPRYLIFGGLVFQELSRPYLQEWGGNWMKDAPQRLVALDVFQNEQPADRGKVVFLSQVFPTANTLGYEDLENLVVSKVNGVPIKSLDDLVKAVSESTEGLLKIEFDDDPPMIVLDPTESKKADEQVRKEYGVPELRNLE
jgi:S1-C subfamily serine protease